MTDKIVVLVTGGNARVYTNAMAVDHIGTKGLE